MKDWTITAADAGTRLDAWLARQQEVGSRGRASEWIARGKVYLNGAAVEPARAGRKLRPGDSVGLWVDRPGSARAVDRAVHDARPLLHVIHEDRAVVVVDKPPGLLVEPLPGHGDDEVTVAHLLGDHFSQHVRARTYVVHRIDRDTSGLVLFARTPAARDSLQAQFEQRTPLRVYQAVVHGRVTPQRGTWTDRLSWDSESLLQRRAHGRDARAKDAIAHYVVLEQFASFALIEVSLVTGKRNQIRVQAGMRGHPLVGERQYRHGFPPEPPDSPTLDRQALHAWRLGFVHPEDGRQAVFTAPLPEDLSRLLALLRAGPPG